MSTDRYEKLDRIAEKVDRAAIKVDEKLAATARKQERKSAKVAERLEKLDEVAGQVADRFGALDVWLRAEPAGRRRPRFSREAIAEAAVAIADAEGFAAVSMRHLASQLGAGTMTLYHYVRTKDELLSLVMDAVMGEVVIPESEEIPDDWREALTMVAHRTRDTLRRHPWILDITDDPPVGPNSVRHFDQSLQAVSSLPISVPERFDIVSVIDEYVFGYCLHERNNVQDDEAGSDPEMTGYIESLIATGEYPQLAELAAEQSLSEVWQQVEAHLRDGRRFDRNLRRLLSGIEADLDL